MNYGGWAEMQQNPNPNAIPNSCFPRSENNDYSASYTYNPNSVPYVPSIDHNNALFPPQPHPPGVDQPYVPPPVTVEYAQQAISYESQPQPQLQPPQDTDATVAAASAVAAFYYADPNASWAQYGAAPYAATATAPNPAFPSQTRNIWKKPPKITKVVQSAWCEVCKIDCNSKGVLDQHKLGKKHKKNLEKLLATIRTPPVPASAPPIPAPAPTPTPTPVPAAIAASTPLSVSTSVPVDKPIIGPQENPNKSKASNASKKRKKAAASTEDLETKRKKVLEGGAAAGSVRLCSICNVVCNSDTVFNYHLAGQKHASMVKKLTSTAGVASAI